MTGDFLAPSHTLMQLLFVLLLVVGEASLASAQSAASPTATATGASDTSGTNSAFSATGDSEECEYDGSVIDYLSCAKDKISTTTLIGAGIGVTLGIFALAFLCIWLTKRKRANAADQHGRSSSLDADEKDLEGRRKSDHSVPKITWEGASEKGTSHGGDGRRRESAIPPVPPVLDLKRSNTQRSQQAGNGTSTTQGHVRNHSMTSQGSRGTDGNDRKAARVDDTASSLSSSDEPDSIARKPSKRFPSPSILKESKSSSSTSTSTPTLSHSRSLSDISPVRRPEAAHLQASVKRPGTEFLQVPDAREGRPAQAQFRRPSTVHSHSRASLIPERTESSTPVPKTNDAVALEPSVHKSVPSRSEAGAQPRPIPPSNAVQTASPHQAATAKGLDGSSPPISRSGSPIPPINPRPLFVSNASHSSSRVSSVYPPSVAPSTISSASGTSAPPKQAQTQASLPTQSATNLPANRSQSQSHDQSQSQAQSQVQAQAQAQAQARSTGRSRASTLSSHGQPPPQMAHSHPPMPMPGSQHGRILPLRGVSTSAVRPVSTASSVVLPTPRFPDSGSKQLEGIPEMPRNLSSNFEPRSEVSRSRTPSPAKPVWMPARDQPSDQAPHADHLAPPLQIPNDPGRRRTPSPSSSVSSSSRRKRETMMVPPNQGQRASLRVDANGRGRSSTAISSVKVARGNQSALVVPGTDADSRSNSLSSDRNRSPSPAPSSVSHTSLVRTQTQLLRQASTANSGTLHGALSNDVRPTNPRTDTGSSSNRASLLPYMQSGSIKPERTGTTPLPIRQGPQKTPLAPPHRTRTDLMSTRHEVSGRPSIGSDMRKDQVDQPIGFGRPAPGEAMRGHHSVHSKSGSSRTETEEMTRQAAHSTANKV
ncbi:hypothetical protein IAU59_001124 [Kwoniella sp. CBS 9459]